MEFLHLATDFSDVTGYASNNTRERSPICLLGLMCGTNAHLFSNIIPFLFHISQPGQLSDKPKFSFPKGN